MCSQITALQAGLPPDQRSAVGFGGYAAVLWRCAVAAGRCFPDLNPTALPSLRHGRDPWGRSLPWSARRGEMALACILGLFAVAVGTNWSSFDLRVLSAFGRLSCFDTAPDTRSGFLGFIALSQIRANDG